MVLIHKKKRKSSPSKEPEPEEELTPHRSDSHGLSPPMAHNSSMPPVQDPPGSTFDCDTNDQTSGAPVSDHIHVAGSNSLQVSVAL